MGSEHHAVSRSWFVRSARAQPQPLPGSNFLHKYRDLGTQLADALVYLAHRDNLDTIFTLERRGFTVYRFSRTDIQHPALAGYGRRNEKFVLTFCDS
jgi:hypothetical protein